MAGAHGIRAGAAFVEIFADDSRMVAGLNRAQRRLEAFGRTSREIGMRLAAASAAMFAPLVMGTKVFMSFDDSMRTVKAVTSATAVEFDMLTEHAERLGMQTSYTASQVADAMIEMGRAGFDPGQIDTAIDGMLSLAKATKTELPRATEIAGNALRGFGLDASEIGRVTDVLAYGANHSAQTLDDLGESLKMVAPLAVEVNEPIESVVASLGVLANVGVKGTMAGTAIARALKNLGDAGRRASLKKLGVESTDAAGNLLPLADILENIGKKTAKLGSAERVGIFETLFGRGSVAAMKLASSSKDIAKFVEGLRQSGGYAKKTADEMESGIGGSWRKLLSATESIFIKIGKAIEVPFKKVADATTKGAQVISRFIADNEELVILAAKIALGLGAAAGAFLAFGLGAATLAMALRGVIMGLKFVSLAFTILRLPIVLAVGAFHACAAALAFLLTPIGLVVAAVLGLGAYFLYSSGVTGKALAWLGDKFAALKARALVAWNAISAALASGDITLAARILWLALKVQWETGINVLLGAWIGFKQAFLDVWDKASYGMLMVANEAWSNLKTSWIELMSVLTTAWLKFVNLVKEGSVTGKVLRTLLKASPLARMLQATGVIKADAFEPAKKARPGEQSPEAVEATKQKLAAVEAGRVAQRDLLSAAAATEKAAREAQYAKDRKKSEDELASARQDYADALEEAADAAELDAINAEALKLLEAIDKKWAAEDKKKLKAGGAAATAAAKDFGKIDVAGSFSAAAAKLMGLGGNAVDRTAAATESTADNTKRLLDKIDDIEARFA